MLPCGMSMLRAFLFRPRSKPGELHGSLYNFVLLEAMALRDLAFTIEADSFLQELCVFVLV